MSTGGVSPVQTTSNFEIDSCTWTPKDATNNNLTVGHRVPRSDYRCLQVALNVWSMSLLPRGFLLAFAACRIKESSNLLVDSVEHLCLVHVLSSSLEQPLNGKAKYPKFNIVSRNYFAPNICLQK